MQPINNEAIVGLNEPDEYDNIISSKSTASVGVLRPQSSFSGIKLGYIRIMLAKTLIWTVTRSLIANLSMNLVLATEIPTLGKQHL